MPTTKEKLSGGFILLTLLAFCTAIVFGVDTGLWNDETITNTYTQNFPLEEVCIGTVCTNYQLSITNNASINASPICTPKNDHCKTNGTGSSMIFGELQAHYSTADGASIPMNTSFQHLYNMTYGEGNEVINQSDTTLRIKHTGYYKITWHLGFTGTNVKTYEIAPLLNGAEMEHCDTYRKLGADLDVGSAAGTCIENLNAEDDIVLAAKIGTGTSTMTLYAANLNIIHIGN